MSFELADAVSANDDDLRNACRSQRFDLMLEDRFPSDGHEAFGAIPRERIKPAAPAGAQKDCPHSAALVDKIAMSRSAAVTNHAPVRYACHSGTLIWRFCGTALSVAFAGSS